MTKSSISVQYDSDQKKIVRWQIGEGFSWDDFDAAVNTTETLINSVSHLVAVLIIAHNFPLPDDAGLQHFLRLVTLPHTHQNGLVLAIADSGSTARFLLQYVQDMYPAHQRAFRDLMFFSDEDQARAFLIDNLEENS
jgi:ABC-type uncharacterized transport system YnjBCD permease subunit